MKRNAATEPDTGYEVFDCPLDQIIVGEQLIRRAEDDEKLLLLTADLTHHRLLQPVGVSPRPDGKWQLRWGGRRYAAFRKLQRSTIPAHIYRGPEEEIKILALVENLHRLQMSIQEECDVVAHLHNVEKLSPDDIALRCSHGRDWVLKRLALPSFPSELQEALFEGAIGLGAAEEIATLQDPSIRNYVLGHAIHDRLSLREVRALVGQSTPLDHLAPATQAAVEAGYQVATTARVLSTCHLCGIEREVHHLKVIRICADEHFCAAFNPGPQPEEENTNGDHRPAA